MSASTATAGMTRIAILIPTLGDERPEQTGGAERNAVNIATMLVEHGVRVDLVLFRATGHYLARVHPAVQVVDLRVTRPFRAHVPVTSGAWRVASFLRSRRPDAVLAFDGRACVAAAAGRLLARSKTRVVATIRSTLSQRWEEEQSPFRRRISGLALRVVHKLADRTTAVSDGVADDLVRNLGLSPDRITVIHNPIVTPHLFAEAAKPAGDPWLDDRDAPVILSAGRLAAPKDFGTLIDAVALVRRGRPVRLVILGEGPLRGELERRVATLGIGADVRLPGFASNPYAFMRRADVFALSSRSEGLPGVLIEAMACGVPVVSTDCPNGPFEVLVGGRWGILVPVGDAPAMAAAIESALDHPTPAPQAAWQRFTYEGVRGRLLEALVGNGHG